MASKIVFVHGMFQNPESWTKWVSFFSAKGYDCAAPAWPLHEGAPSSLRATPPEGLGELRLNTVIGAMEEAVGDSRPIMIGHSVGGLIAQILLNRGLLSAAVAIDSVAPNGIIDFDFSALKNIAVIINPLKGDQPFEMDMKTFQAAFANTLSERDAAVEFERTATPDSRNVLRDCLGEDGKIAVERTQSPLLLIGGEKDEIVPQHLSEKNFAAYGPVAFKAFPNRSHYICGEPGWEEVAGFVAQWLQENLVRDYVSDRRVTQS